MLLEQGVLVKSKAGHDKDCIYVIISVNDEYVYLADGKVRTVCHTKKKNRKHVQVIYKVQHVSIADDVSVRNAIREYIRRNKDNQEL